MGSRVMLRPSIGRLPGGRCDPGLRADGAVP
jgi:hypothetical protein